MLIDNVLFLRQHYPTIRTYFSQHEKTLRMENWEVVPSKSGNATICYKKDKPLMVHSLYDPIREAERIILPHKEKINEKTHVFFYGIGLGYHVEKFKEQFPNNSFSLYEPIPEVFYTLSTQKQLKNMITKNTRNLYVDTGIETTSAYLDEFRSSNQNIHIIVLPSYKNILQEKYEQFYTNIKATIYNRRSHLHTNASFQKLWILNSFNNFETVLHTPNILKDIDRQTFEGKPVIIVSAGPSLVEDIKHLRYIQENNLAYLFSVGSAINSLIEYDICPDAVFTYDPKERNQNVFKKMFDREIMNIPMVFGSSVGYETVEKYAGPKIHFITSQDRTSLYFLSKQINEEEEVVFDSPSIAVMAFQITNKLGANPIIFAGQNLGFLKDRRFAEGIAYDHIPSKVDEKTLDNALIVQDVYGNEMKTNRSFEDMRTAIEKYAKIFNKNKFINTTKGGAAIEGIPFMPIEQVITKKLTHPVQKRKWWENQSHYNQTVIANKYAVLKKSKHEFVALLTSFDNVINAIEKQCKIRNENKLFGELQKFDVLYNYLQENVYYKNFVSFYIRIHVNYIENEIKRLNQQTNVFMKGTEIVTRFQHFLNQCKQGSTALDSLFKKHIHDKFAQEVQNEKN